MGNPDAVATPLRVARPGRSPGDPLDVLLEHVKANPRVDAAALLLVDPERTRIDRAASWFASPLLREAVEPTLERAYDRGNPGLVEATLERERPLFLPRLGDWEAAPTLRAQVEAHAEGHRTDRAWQALSGASVIGCTVRTALGRTLGVLLLASIDPQHVLGRADLQTALVLADLAGLATERSELLDREAERAREEVLLARAAESTAASLESAEVERLITEHALRLIDADCVQLSRVRPGSRRIVPAAFAGAPLGPGGVDLDSEVLGEVLRTRQPVRSNGGMPSAHVPLGLGPRLFGVLSAVRRGGPPFQEHELELLWKLARISAAAMANAVEFERERRIARALTRGFVPESPPPLPEYEVGLLYEPAEDQPAGGDLYGVWPVAGGEVAILVGDVAGKGVETAALSAMARFFIEARTWDCTSPADVLVQADTMLRSRLPSDSFVTGFLGFLGGGRLRYANAGHLPPMVLRAGGGIDEALGGGLPLGVEEGSSWEEHEIALAPGDLVMGYTDGLVEARRDGELLGTDRLRGMVAGAFSRAEGVDDFVRLVHDAAHTWASGLSDDVVVLALRHHVP